MSGPARDARGLRVLVLGAGGFIGVNLCRALVRAGSAVVGFGRPPQHAAALTGVNWIEAEFDDTPRLREAVAGSDLVYHLLGGGLPAVSNQDPVGDAMTAIPPSLRLLEACRDAGTGKLVFVSSGGTVYGRHGDAPVREDAATDPISAYGVSKLSVEKYIQLFHHLYGLDYAILRVGNPYGPFQSTRRPQGVIATLLHKVVTGEEIEIWGDGSVVRDFVYVDDLVEAMIAVGLRSCPTRLFNVGSGVGRSLRSIIDDVAQVTGPAMTGVRYAAARSADVPVSVLDCGLIRREIGWRPATAWMDGLRTTYDWLRAQPSGRAT